MADLPSTGTAHVPYAASVSRAGDEWIPLADAARILGVAQSTMREWDNAGLFPSTWRTRGNHRRFSRLEVEAVMRKRAGADPDEPRSDLLTLVELAIGALRSRGVGTREQARMLADDLDALADRTRRLADQVRREAGLSGR